MPKEEEPERTFVESNLRDDHEGLISVNSAPLWKRHPVQGVFLLLVFSAGMIPLIYWLSYDVRGRVGEKEYTCVIEPGYRVPCGVVDVVATQCKNVSCCYDEISEECYHAAPTQYFYTGEGSGPYAPSLQKTPFRKPSVAEMNIVYEELVGRFQVVLTDASFAPASKRANTYRVERPKDGSLAVEVFRQPSNDRILSTAFGPLIASEDYWEWTVLLSTQYLFGLGQLIIPENATLSKVFYKNENDHHTIPAFMAYTNGSFHGMVVDHDGPLEVTVLPSKLIVLRSLVGRKITLNMFPGPTPNDVMLQMRSYDFAQPSDWLFEPHICRGGNVTTLSKVISDYNKKKDSGINYGIDCLNENLVMMLMREETSNFGDLQALITKIKTDGKKFSLVITPHVPVGETYSLYRKAVDLDVLYKNNVSAVHLGRYKNIDVAFLDVTAPKINDWLDALTTFIAGVIDPSSIDSIALLDNWPAEDTYNMTEIKGFSYMNKNISLAMSHTIPWNLKTSEAENHIFTHNTYPQAFLKLIEAQIPGKPIFTSAYGYGLDYPVLTRNAETTWTDFRKTMVSNLFHGMFSHPLVSSPVCGSKHFRTVQEERVCLKWYFMAATMPLFYANEDWPVQKSAHGAGVVVNALETRKQLAHYYKHFIRKQEQVSRPMFYEYHSDNATFALDEQYMLGNALLVCFPVYPTSSLRVYLPKGDEWFEFWGGGFIETRGWILMNDIETDWPIFIKAGTIVPLRITGATGDKFSLTSAYKCRQTEEGTQTCTAEGVLRYDEAYLTITITDSVLTIENIDAVKTEINCIDDIKPRIVDTVKIFTKQGREFYNVGIDLCAQTNDDYSQTLTP